MADILLIEDDESVRRVVRRWLEGMGHEIREASDGHAGVALYREAPAEVVLTDIVMPEEDGLGAINELRRWDPNVRIIAMSGGGFCLDADDCLSQARTLGAKEMLSKPFGSEELAGALARVLGQ